MWCTLIMQYLAYEKTSRDIFERGVGVMGLLILKYIYMKKSAPQKWVFRSVLWCLIVTMVLFPVIHSSCYCCIVGFWDSNPSGVSLVPYPSRTWFKLLFTLLGGGGVPILFWPCVPFTLVRTWKFILYFYTLSACIWPVSAYDIRQSLFISTLWL